MIVSRGALYSLGDKIALDLLPCGLNGTKAEVNVRRCPAMECERESDAEEEGEAVFGTQELINLCHRTANYAASKVTVIK